MIFIEVKSLAGTNFIRAAEVIAVQYVDATRCTLLMAGGLSIPCSEPAREIASRIETALQTA